MGSLGRLLIAFGLVSVVVGAFLVFGPKVPILGKLPGDFLIRRGSTTIYLPLATSLALSLILTFLLNLFWR